MSSPLSLGQLLRSYRLQADLTLEALAELSTVSDRTISDIERGVSAGPQHRTLEALANALALGEKERDRLFATARAGRHVTLDGRAVTLEPHRLPDFTGRETEITQILAFLDVGGETGEGIAPVVVVCGAAGVGKTSTAVEALHRCRSDRPASLFVDLHGLNSLPLSPLQVLQALLRQLPSTSTQDSPKTLDAARAMWRDASTASPAAVLLDNAMNEAQVRPVLVTGRQGAVVVTSRRTLSGLEGIRRVTLGPLSSDDSIRLLDQIVPATQRATGTLAELAELCDHIPLALRIAGNRLASQPNWTVDDFAARLRSEEGRLRALVAGDLAIEAAFALSYEHLSAPAQSLFRYLSLLEGSTFTPALAAVVYGGDVHEVEDRLDELSDLGLVQPLAGNRFRLHDLLKLFAASRLRDDAASEEIAAQRRRLTEWLLSTTIGAGAWFEPAPNLTSGTTETPPLPFASADEARAWLQAEAEHWFAAVRAAAANRRYSVVLDTAEALHWFSDLWVSWGHWHELFALSARAAAEIDSTKESVHLGYLAWANIVEQSNYDEALVNANRALAAAERADDTIARAWSYFYIAWSHRNSRRYAAASGSIDRSIDLFASSENVEGEIQAITLAADILTEEGRLDEAVKQFRLIVELLRTPHRGIPENIARFTELNTLVIMSSALLELGRSHEAIAAAHESLALSDELKYPRGRARALYHLGRVQVFLGNTDAASEDYAAALSVLADVGDSKFEDEVRDALAGLSGDRT